MRRKLIYLISFVLVLSIAGNTSAELIGHWKVDGNLDDSAGSENGTFTGGTPGYGAGMVNQALMFDGIDDYLELPSPTSPTIYTIASWVKLASTDAASIIARTSGSGTTTHWSHQLRVNSSGVFEHYTWDGSARIVTGTTAIEVDTWYSVTGSDMYASITFGGARWTDRKGFDTQFFVTGQDVVADVDVTYNGKTYSYRENFGQVSTFSRETHNFEIVTDITDTIYEEGGAGLIFYTITVREGSDILTEGQLSGEFSMG